MHEIQSLIAPPSLDDRTAQLVDMTGDGLPDVLQSFGSRMLLWRNRGDGSLQGPTALDGVPSTVSLDRDNVALADLDGDGRVGSIVKRAEVQHEVWETRLQTGGRWKNVPLHERWVEATSYPPKAFTDANPDFWTPKPAAAAPAKAAAKPAASK